LEWTIEKEGAKWVPIDGKDDIQFPELGGLKSTLLQQQEMLILKIWIKLFIVPVTTIG